MNNSLSKLWIHSVLFSDSIGIKRATNLILDRLQARIKANPKVPVAYVSQHQFKNPHQISLHSACSIYYNLNPNTRPIRPLWPFVRFYV